MKSRWGGGFCGRNVPILLTGTASHLTSKIKRPFSIVEAKTVRREIENETWDIDSFFEVSPERNEINQNTENGVLYNFDINNGPGAIENDNSIPLQTTSSPRTDRIQIPVLELNDVQNQIPVRRSERLKSKLMSVHLVNNVPNSYFEAENSANWKNWKLAMENELDSLDKHKLKKIRSSNLGEKPEDLTRKDEMDWITKNSDAIAYIKLSLADEQALQFAAEDNAKVLWDKIRATYMGEGEDRNIDRGYCTQQV
ncbi:retrovirus-related Pol polyprotein from transposon TNT 1-94 [Trichonephila clavipes]|nr:retrovirus-related Pol polyprotein from transposon TNT 1-94 [Trichonephila clavipes]